MATHEPSTTALWHYAGVACGSVVKLSCLPEHLWYCENHVGDVCAVTLVHGRGVVYGVELRNRAVAQMFRRAAACDKPPWLYCTRRELELYDYERACIVEPTLGGRATAGCLNSILASPTRCK